MKRADLVCHSAPCNTQSTGVSLCPEQVPTGQRGGGLSRGRCFHTALVLPGIELNFFIVAGVGLHVGFVLETVLIVHGF